MYQSTYPVATCRDYDLNSVRYWLNKRNVKRARKNNTRVPEKETEIKRQPNILPRT